MNNIQASASSNSELGFGGLPSLPPAVLNFKEEAEKRDVRLKVVNELNRDHIFIENFGGKSRITRLALNQLTKKDMLEFLPIDTFRDIYSNRKIEIKDEGTNRTRSAKIADIWLEDEKRNTVKGVIFDPAMPSGVVEVNEKRYLNMWQGFAVEPKKGDWHKIRKHIWNVLCNKDKRIFKYVIKWLAFLVQHPDKLPRKQVNLKGKQGAGKGIIWNQFVRIFGPHAMHLSDPEDLTGRFSGHLPYVVFLFADEIFAPNDFKVIGRLNNLITEETISIRAMRQDTITVPNHLHIGGATNNEWVDQARGNDTRRYFTVAIDNKYAKGECSDRVRELYFSGLLAEIKNGGTEAMLFDLLRVNLKGFNPEVSPETDEMRKQKMLSLHKKDKIVFELLNGAALPVYTVDRLETSGYGKDKEYRITADAMKNYLEKQSPGSKYLWQQVTGALKELGVHKGKISTSVWWFPEITVMRKRWEKIYGPVDWDVVIMPARDRDGQPQTIYVNESYRFDYVMKGDDTREIQKVEGGKGKPVTVCVELSEWQIVRGNWGSGD